MDVFLKVLTTLWLIAVAVWLYREMFMKEW